MLTIFTPTYNRAYIIDKLYQSLLNQTNFDFEWVVVDDGSTDETENYFLNLLKKENPFKIIYFKQKNGGKHRAINMGVKIAHGDLFFIVDSDDHLAENAVDRIYFWVDTLPDRKKWAGVAGLRGYDENHIIGSTFQGEFRDATSLERFKFQIKGDKAEVFFTDILKKFSFKEFENENFLTENTVWFLIAKAGYPLRWFNEIIYICDYLEDGLTRNMQSIYLKNPQGALYTAKLYLECYPNNFKKKYKTIYQYYQVASFHHLTNREIAKNLGVSVITVIFAKFLNWSYHLIK